MNRTKISNRGRKVNQLLDKKHLLLSQLKDIDETLEQYGIESELFGPEITELTRKRGFIENSNRITRICIEKETKIDEEDCFDSIHSIIT